MNFDPKTLNVNQELIGLALACLLSEGPCENLRVIETDGFRISHQGIVKGANSSWYLGIELRHHSSRYDRVLSVFKWVFDVEPDVAYNPDRVTLAIERLRRFAPLEAIRWDEKS